MSPSLKSAAAVPNPSPGPGLSCLCSFLLFDHGNPELFYAHRRTWWTANLRELYYNMDKEYSQVASKLAIPQLLKEINILRNPQQAEERFRVFASGAGLPETPI